MSSSDEEPDDALEFSYGAGRVVDCRALQVLELLPGAEVSGTRDVVQINWGGEEGIVVLITPEALELRLPTVEWTCGAYGPVASSQLWRRVKWESVPAGQLPLLLDKCKRARTRQYRRCKYCGEKFLPERRTSGNVCHGCASKHEGVVF